MQFLDINGVKRIKRYTDDTFVTSEDVSEIEDASLDFYTKSEIDEMISNIDSSSETSYEDDENNTSFQKGFILSKKVYTGVLGVANGTSPNNNSYANQSVYFLTIIPKTWNAQWSVKYRLNIHLDNETQQYKSSSTAGVINVGRLMRGTYDCNITGTGGTYTTFHFFQSQNTSYRSIYYHMIHETTAAGFDAGQGHKIGVSFYYSYLPTPVTDYSSGSAVASTKYSRTIEVILEEAVNCTATLLDNLEVEGDAYREDYSKLNTTYYITNTSGSNAAGRWVNLYATTQGLYESGDDNTVTYTQQTNNYLKNANKTGDTDLRLLGYPLIGFNKDGNVLGISNYSATQATSTVNLNVKGARVYCTEGFDYTKGIEYISTSSVFGINADINISTYINYSGLDLRYSDNCVASNVANSLGLVARKPVYLRGIIGSDGLFYLAPIDVTYDNKTYQRAWVQDIPSIENEDGEYVYWFIGYPYYSSSYAASLYQLNLITQGELVWYKDGNLRPYIPDSSGGWEANVIETVKVNGTALTPDSNKAVNVTVPTKVSDLTDDAISGSYLPLTGGDMSSEASIRLKNANFSMVLHPFGLVKESNEQSHALQLPDASGTIALTSQIPDISGKQDTITDLATIRSGAALGATALQSYTETDPTVPAWAKASTKPVYTASEVGALPINGGGTVTDYIDVYDNGHSYGVEIYGGTDNNLGVTVVSDSDRTVYGNGTIQYINERITIPQTTGTMALTSQIPTSLASLSTDSSHRTVTDTEKTTWNAKQKAITISSSEPTSSQGSDGDIWIVI